MSAKDRAKELSLKATADRVDKVANRGELDAIEPQTFTYQGHDPKSGKSLIQSSQSCCDSVPVADGDRLTNAGISKGEIILPRQTQGFTRIDKKPVITRKNTPCSGYAKPVNRGGSNFGIDGGDVLENIEQELEPDKPTFADPPVAGQPVEGSGRCQGFAYVYEAYTGNVLDDGTFETETIRQPDSPNCTNPNNPLRPVENDDDGCVKPGQEETGTLKSCQWFRITEDQANNYTGCPTGTFNSGFREFPEGDFFALCCTEDESPATEAGVSRDWSPENATESGTAAESTNYCSGSYQAELIWDQGSITTLSPPISYSLSVSSDKGGLFESVSIPAANPPAVKTNTINSYDQIFYYFEVTGTAQFAFDRDYDAAWAWFKADPTTPIVRRTGGAYSDQIGGAVISDSPDYNYPIHIYSITKKPNSSGLLSFYQIDTVTGDNAGSLTVNIYGASNIVFNLSVSDGTGEILNQQYTSEPTGFSYVCRTNTKTC